MKKGKIILILILTLVLTNFSLAQTNLGQTGEKISKTLQQNPEDFAKEKFTNYIENSGIKSLLENINDFLSPLDPAFNLIIGSEFEWSLKFFLNLILWIFLTILVYRLLSVFSILSPLLRTFLSILSITLITLIQFTQLLSKFLIEIISIPNNILLQIILFFVLILILLILMIYSKLIEDLITAIKKTKEKNKLKTQTKDNKTQLATISEELNKIRKERELNREEKELEQLAESEIRGMRKT
jgi:uncharacterized membrane protein